MNYRVVRIEEDVEFGCEERKEGDPVMAVVRLERPLRLNTNRTKKKSWQTCFRAMLLCSCCAPSARMRLPNRARR